MNRRRHPTSAAFVVLGSIGLLAGCSGSHDTSASHPSTPPVRPTTPSTTAPAVVATTTTTDPPATVAGAPPVKSGSPQLAPVPAASLSLSAGSASVGTSVTVTATGCPPPMGGYTGFFADSQALGDPQTPSYRHTFTLTGTGGTGATGTYVVTSADTAGFGLMEVPCGAATNAVAVLTVG